MMKLRKLLLILSLVVMLVTDVQGKEVCPRMCTCDVFEGYKRADCSDQNLASPYTNVAKSVEILNLSGNEITIIDDHCLRDYKDLIKLSFARNSIHTIDFFAFEMLSKLNYLDLSDNRLEVVDNRILETNDKLMFLDLSKNKFMLVDDKPLIISRSLELLSLRNSHLSHVYESFFSEVPNLADLDISNNLLITLMSDAFEPLENLQFINLEYNRFTCDFRIESCLQMFKQRKVHVKIDKCVKNSKKPMFEKMILHPDMTTASPEREDVEIDLLWGPSTGHEGRELSGENSTGKVSFKDYYMKIKTESENDDDEFDCDDDELFPSTCECHQKFIKYYESVERLKPLQKQNMELRIAAVFYIGIFLGVIAGGIIFFVLSLIRKKCENANRKQIERQTARDRVLLQNVRIAESSRHSPLPVIRNQLVVPQQQTPRQAQQQSRSPIPTPRNFENQNRTSESPNVNRRTDNFQRPRTSTPVQTRAEPSPTALLINKLFRNRDPRLLPEPSEISLLTPPRSTSLTPLAPIRATVNPIQEETVYSEIPSPTAPIQTERDEDDVSSEYLSNDNLSLSLNLDNLRSQSTTPPPAYRSIFDEDGR